MLLDENGKQFDIEQLAQYDKIIFYGASSRNKAAIKDLAIEDKVLYYVDSNPKRCGSSVDGYEIHEVGELAQTENTLVISVLVKYVDDILDKIQKYPVKCLFYSFEMYDVNKIVEQNEKIIARGNTYKYIHVVPALPFTRFFYEMMEENDDISQHLFLVNWYRQDDKFKIYQFICEKNIQNNNILVLNDFCGFTAPYIDGRNINQVFFSDQMDKIFAAADKIVLHSALMDKAGRTLMSNFADKMGEKMCWICAGNEGNENSPIVDEVLRKIRITYTTGSANIKYIQQNYKIPVKEIRASYCYIAKNTLKKITEKNDVGMQNRCVNILLGHAAVEYGNHIYGLKLLEKFRDENIKIYCPLSYSHPGKEYFQVVNDIIEKGKGLFGDKFIPILDYIEPDEYHAFLQTMDVALFPLTRLAAGTTVTYLGAIDKKIYMSEVMCEHFAYLDIRVEDMEHIRNQSFEEFIDCPDTDGTVNRILELNERAFLGWKKRLED